MWFMLAARRRLAQDTTIIMCRPVSHESISEDLPASRHCNLSWFISWSSFHCPPIGQPWPKHPFSLAVGYGFYFFNFQSAERLHKVSISHREHVRDKPFARIPLLYDTHVLCVDVLTPVILLILRFWVLFASGTKFLCCPEGTVIMSLPAIKAFRNHTEACSSRMYSMIRAARNPRESRDFSMFDSLFFLFALSFSDVRFFSVLVQVPLSSQALGVVFQLAIKGAIQQTYFGLFITNVCLSGCRNITGLNSSLPDVRAQATQNQERFVRMVCSFVKNLMKKGASKFVRELSVEVRVLLHLFIFLHWALWVRVFVLCGVAFWKICDVRSQATQNQEKLVRMVCSFVKNLMKKGASKFLCELSAEICMLLMCICSFMEGCQLLSFFLYVSLFENMWCHSVSIAEAPHQNQQRFSFVRIETVAQRFPITSSVWSA